MIWQSSFNAGKRRRESLAQVLAMLSVLWQMPGSGEEKTTAEKVSPGQLRLTCRDAGDLAVDVRYGLRWYWRCLDV